MPRKPSEPKPVVVNETCSECGHIGRAGTDIVPYSFSKGDKRWLCSVGMARKCLETAWQKFKSSQPA